MRTRWLINDWLVDKVLLVFIHLFCHTTEAALLSGPLAVYWCWPGTHKIKCQLYNASGLTTVEPIPFGDHSVLFSSVRISH